MTEKLCEIFNNINVDKLAANRGIELTRFKMAFCLRLKKISQQKLANLLLKEGFQVNQTAISRFIRGESDNKYLGAVVDK